MLFFFFPPRVCCVAYIFFSCFVFASFSIFFHVFRIAFERFLCMEIFRRFLAFWSHFWTFLSNRTNFEWKKNIQQINPFLVQRFVVFIAFGSLWWLYTHINRWKMVHLYRKETHIYRSNECLGNTMETFPLRSSVIVLHARLSTGNIGVYCCFLYSTGHVPWMSRSRQQQVVKWALAHNFHAFVRCWLNSKYSYPSKLFAPLCHISRLLHTYARHVLFFLTPVPYSSKRFEGVGVNVPLLFWLWVWFFFGSVYVQV